MPELLHIPNIEAKPKQIVQLSSWRDAVGLSKFPMQQNALIEILASIKSGKPIPVGYYRVSTGTDTLLEQEGIIHFTSRSRRNTRMQFDTHVLLLEVSDHYHFETEPPGETLLRLHNRNISTWKDEQDKAAADKKAADEKAAAAKNTDIRARSHFLERPLDRSSRVACLLLRASRV